MRFISTSCKGVSHFCNEDSYVVRENIAVVADGMGGENAGEVASHLAVENLLSCLKKQDFTKMEDSEIFKYLEGIVIKCDSMIQTYSFEHPETIGMGTTVVIAIIVGQTLYVCWCGDSRCFVYNLISDKISYSTHDHSYVQNLIDQKQISVKDSFTHPDNNIITRYVGGGEEYAIPECGKYQLQDNDIVLLCSDGLTGYCTNEEIIETIKHVSDSPKELCKALSSMAISKGSEDDITILISNIYNKNSWKNHFPFNIFS